MALQNYIDDKTKVKNDLKELREKIEKEGVSDKDIKKYYVSNFAESEEDFLCTFDKVKDYLFKSGDRKKILDITDNGSVFDKMNVQFDDLLTQTEIITKSNQEIKKISGWSVRGDSQFSKKKGKILFDRIFEKVKNAQKEAKVSYNGLHEKGVFLGKYTIDSTDYKIALYTNKSPIAFTKYQVKDYCDLIDNKKASPFVKVTEINNSLILAFFDDKKSIDFMVQLMSDNDKKFKKVIQWFGVLEGAEYEKSEETSNNPLTIMKLRKESNGNKQEHVGKFGCVRYFTGKKCSHTNALYVVKGKNKAHMGIDLLAPQNTPIYSAVDGIAYVYPGEIPGYGKTISVQGKLKNLKTGKREDVYVVYAHLNSASVKNGDKVKIGDILGKTGITGNGRTRKKEEYHLHLEILTQKWPQKAKKFTIRKPPLDYFKIINP